MWLGHAEDNSRDFDADEVSPYRRRQKAVRVRSRRFARLGWLLRRLLAAALALLGIAYVIRRVAVFALTSPVFLLNSAADVAVAGNHYASKEEIVKALGIPSSTRTAVRRTGVNIFELSLERARSQVESIPWVRSAAVTRAYPHHLNVRVEERVPVAFVNVEGRIKLVDGEGAVLESPARATFDFPVLAGLDSGLNLTERRSRLRLYREFMRQIADEAAPSGWVVSEVDLSDADDLKAVVVREHQSLELHLGREGFGQRFHNFLALLPELAKSTASARSIDLRYGNQVVVNPQPPRAAAPRAASRLGSKRRRRKKQGVRGL